MSGEPLPTEAVSSSSPPALMPRKIVLTGFMGTGKSTIGQLLARQLRFDHLDTDQLFEAVHGSIHVVFAEHGEVGFRRLEREIVTGLSGVSRTVISTGGGTLLDPSNLEALKPGAAIFCLVATVDDILKRVTRTASRRKRPLLLSADPRDRIEQLLAERAPVYSQFTQVITTGMSPLELAQLIAAKAAFEAQHSGGDKRGSQGQPPP